MINAKFRTAFSNLQYKENEVQKTIDHAKLDFNIFSILRELHEEVGLHSRFISELLNPFASHKIEKFQQLFIHNVLNNAIEYQDWRRRLLDPNIPYRCYMEYTFYNSKYGRADIILKNKSNIIVIENKIYAYDQKGQLAKYYKACKEMGYRSQNIYILYLNLHGRDITTFGKGDIQDIDYGVISYREDIFEFLQLCKSESSNYPHIEKTIEQYISIVAKLTGQTMTANLKNEYIHFLEEENNFKTAYTLSNHFQRVQKNVQNKVLYELIDHFKEYNIEFTFCNNQLIPCNQEKSVNNYFKRGGTNYGLCHRIGIKDGIEIYCYIEIHHVLYYSITLAEKNGLRLANCPKNLEPFKAQVISLSNKWEYEDKTANLGGQIYPRKRINFKNPNDAFFDIVSKDHRAEWVKETCGDIIKLIDDVKKLKSQNIMWVE